MANRLAEIPGAEKAEKETREILVLVEKAIERLDNCNRLRDVWQAVEWYDSHDWGMDQVQKYLEKLND
jgi:hypothetical protein